MTVLFETKTYTTFKMRSYIKNIPLTYVIICLVSGAINACQNSSLDPVYSRPDDNANIRFAMNTVEIERAMLSIYHPDGGILLNVTIYNSSTYEFTTVENCILLGNPLQGELILQMVSVTTSDAGVYRLISSDQNDTLQCITLYILGIPTKPVIDVGEALERGGNVNISCRSYSTTLPSNPTLVLAYSWLVDEDINPDLYGRLKYSTNKDTVVFQNVSREDMLIPFKCIATEEIHGGFTSRHSEQAFIDVLYGPDNMRLEPAEHFLTVAEGFPFPTVKCHADCNPTCSYWWTKLSDFEADIVNYDSVLDLGIVIYNDTATYNCYARRTSGATTKIQLNIFVAYKPRTPLWIAVKQIKNIGLIVSWEEDTVTDDQQQVYCLKIMSETTDVTKNVSANDTFYKLTERIYLFGLINIESGMYNITLSSVNEHFPIDSSPLETEIWVIESTSVDGTKTIDRNTVSWIPFMVLSIILFCICIGGVASGVVYYRKKLR